MSLKTELGLNDEINCMVEILVRLKKVHRVTMEFNGEGYLIRLEVGEACMIGGWMEIRSLPGLIQWLVTKN